MCLAADMQTLANELANLTFQNWRLALEIGERLAALGTRVALIEQALAVHTRNAAQLEEQDRAELIERVNAGLGSNIVSLSHERSLRRARPL